MRHRIQLWVAVAMVAFGVIIIMVSFFIPPIGVIDSSVLVAFGEVLTFSGSLLGIDYKYKLRDG